MKSLVVPKDLRKGQALFNFLNWLATAKKSVPPLDLTLTSSDKRAQSHFQLGDTFYIPDDKIEAYWDEYVTEMNSSR